MTVHDRQRLEALTTELETVLGDNTSLTNWWVHVNNVLNPCSAQVSITIIPCTQPRDRGQYVWAVAVNTDPSLPGGAVIGQGITGAATWTACRWAATTLLDLFDTTGPKAAHRRSAG